MFGVKFRHDTAITGEILPSGMVLMVGKMSEKCAVATDRNIHRLVLPRENHTAITLTPSANGKVLELVPVDNVWDAFKEMVVPGHPGEFK